MDRLAIVAVVSAGCWTGTATPAPVTDATLRMAPACRAAFVVDEAGDAKLVVNGKELADLDTGAIEGHAESSTATVFPYTATAILLGWTTHGHNGAPAGSETLHAVECAHPEHHHPFATLAGGDFGHAVRSRDGTQIYASGADGLYTLDVATGAIRPLTRAPKVDQCWDSGSGADYQLRDSVVSLDDVEDVLHFQRGGNCGFESDWTSEELYLDHPAHPAAPRPPRPVRAVALDASGTVWASDGSCKTAELARSRDRGAHWTTLSIAGAEESPQVILPDAKRAGHLVVVTTGCPGGYGMPWGERIFATRDGGKTWRAIDFPPEMATFVHDEHGAPEKFHEPLSTAVELRDGSIDRLVLWGRNGDGESIGTWESRDGGASWAAIKTLPRPRPQSNEVVFDGATWRTSDDGLLRAGTHRRMYVR